MVKCIRCGGEMIFSHLELNKDTNKKEEIWKCLECKIEARAQRKS